MYVEHFLGIDHFILKWLRLKWPTLSRNPMLHFAETLAHALQGLRPAPVPTIKLGRFVDHSQRSGDPTLTDWLDDFFYLCSPVGSVGG